MKRRKKAVSTVIFIIISKYFFMKQKCFRSEDVRISGSVFRRAVFGDDFRGDSFGGAEEEKDDWRSQIDLCGYDEDVDPVHHHDLRHRRGQGQRSAAAAAAGAVSRNGQVTLLV